MIRRWLSIKLYRTDGGRWVWADHGGWGTGVFNTRLGALARALRGDG